MVNKIDHKSTLMANLGWVVCALTSALCYALFNTITAQHINEDIWSAKFINSVTMGFAALIYRIAQTLKMRRNEADFNFTRVEEYEIPAK